MKGEETGRIGSARLVAGGFDGFTALDWIRDTETSVTGALAAWDQGELVEVPAGKAWDVVRVPRALGWRTVQQMRQAGTPVGPAQHTPDAVEVLVPVGSAARWELPDAEVLTEGARVAVPHPATVAPRTQMGHTWIVSPQEGGPLTEADLLHEAYAAALATVHMGGAR
ncbi:hypothetical protein [Streptomyces sp. NBC_00582]|uniref:hypothetical protein n=1 Tax=Streptomyces sp. NBC_00582 TaxID=2975783 RepID=UPI002E7FD766|nr:hypothetical protein [Streptomyces sp. NBC_00582]WUB64593.1 hypothetical protein OG852_31440 [Streptomyces sp. NBC_00582]